jgi:hypothetical protein
MVLLLLTAALAAEPALSSEAGAEAESGAHDGQVEHHQWVLGVKLVGLATPSGHEAWHTYFGPGVLVEVAVPGAPVEIELAVAYLGELDQIGHAVPVDILAKGVHRVGRTDLFLGAGPMVTFTRSKTDDHMGVFPGVLGTSGVACWFSSSMAVHVEVDAGLTFPSGHGGHAVHSELEYAVGLLYGF